MTTFSSKIQILVVENETRKSAKTGNDWKHFAARSVLLNDDGSVNTVGALRVRNPALQAMCRPGTFTASFAMQVPDFGDDKGDIVAVLTGLTPIETKAQAQAK